MKRKLIQTQEKIATGFDVAQYFTHLAKSIASSTSSPDELLPQFIRGLSSSTSTDIPLYLKQFYQFVWHMQQFYPEAYNQIREKLFFGIDQRNPFPTQSNIRKVYVISSDAQTPDSLLATYLMTRALQSQGVYQAKPTITSELDKNAAEAIDQIYGQGFSAQLFSQKTDYNPAAKHLEERPSAKNAIDSNLTTEEALDQIARFSSNYLFVYDANTDRFVGRFSALDILNNEGKTLDQVFQEYLHEIETLSARTTLTEVDRARLSDLKEKFLSIDRSQSLNEALANTLIYGNIPSIPVIREGKLEGILSLDDLLTARKQPPLATVVIGHADKAEYLDHYFDRPTLQFDDQDSNRGALTSQVIDYIGAENAILGLNDLKAAISTIYDQTHQFNQLAQTDKHALKDLFLRYDDLMHVTQSQDLSRLLDRSNFSGLVAELKKLNLI